MENGIILFVVGVLALTVVYFWGSYITGGIDKFAKIKNNSDREKPIMEVSPMGIIRVLDVPLCAPHKAVEDIISKRGYNIVENEEHKIRAIPSLQKYLCKINTRYLIIEEVIFWLFFTSADAEKKQITTAVNWISFYLSGSKKECNTYFEYLKSLFVGYNIEKEKDGELMLYNTLYKVSLTKYKQEFGTYRLRVEIKAKFGDEKIATEYTRPTNEQVQIIGGRKLSAIKKERILLFISAVLSACLLTIAYLSVLNDRYHISDKGAVYFDKWTKTLYELGENRLYKPISK